MVADMVIIEIEEESLVAFSRSELSDNIARILFEEYSDKLDVTLPSIVNDRYILRTRGYIGYLPINQQYVLRIYPKVRISNIFRMLEYAYRVKLHFPVSPEFVNVELIEDVFESVAAVLARGVLERSRKGLYRGYVQKADTLSYMRGRIRLSSTILASLRGSIQLHCEYDDFTADIAENQILAWTLSIVSRYRFQRSEVQSLVRRAYREVASMVKLKPYSPADCIKRLYHKLNHDYQPLHLLCRFFLEQGGPTLNSGDYGFLPFTLHMPSLFEAFIAEWLQMHLPSGYRLKRQYRVYLDSGRLFHFRLDLVLVDIQTDTIIAILDTKYKHGSRPAMQDIEQSIAYAVAANTQNAFLIYPSSIISSPLLHAGRDVQVHIVAFDLSENLESSGQEFIRTIFEKLQSTPANMT